MDPTTLRLIQGAAGAAASSLYVDDVFSTFLTLGSSGQTVTNGIDLSTEGGMVWSKARDVSVLFGVHDTERGVNKFLSTNSDAAQTDVSSNVAQHTITSFNTDGFTTGADGGYGCVDLSGYGNYVSWSFRKAPGFFTCVQYTGTGSNRSVSHDLASTPGMIFVKCINSAGTNWLVYHTSLGPTKAEILDLTTGPVTSAGPWNNTAPTSTEFTVGVSNDVNKDGDTYIAYLFANDEPVFGTNEDESIIKCGSFTTNVGGTLDAPVDLGFEPQFILTKNAGGQWYIFDTLRGVGATDTVCHTLRPNATNAEQSRTAGSFTISSTGFDIPVFSLFSGGQTMPYMAIRRPNKPPSAATDVFSPTAYTGNETARVVGTNFCDFVILSDLDADSPGWVSLWAQYAFTRLLSADGALATTNNNVLSTGWATVDLQGDYFQFDVNNNNGLALTAVTGYMNNTGTNYVLYNFTRAPGFFDIVEYSGNSTAGTSHNHNLEAIPEFIICKSYLAGGGAGFWCYHKDLTTNNAIRMDGSSNGSAAEQSTSNYWNSSTHSTTTFTLGDYGDINGSGKTFISYLFSTLSGISKVGSYSGTGNAINVDCGFASGAKFVMIKRKNGTGDWYVWDSARGIISGDDPYLLLNNPQLPVTNTDYIDPLSSGFTVTSSAPAALNTSGGTYIFLAIA